MILRNKKKGQGVVEYAGALVIAALVVTAVIVAGPSNLSTMFNSVVTAVSGKLTGAL
ncbi:MAG: Flp family type IVb pilin [Cyanobacteria bacterium]|jgi:Flp pilus assembly pilin Flp|nr:Flp family type IVb pilin [Cyanobacteriota bacterium]